jgi:hypothetical protein
MRNEYAVRTGVVLPYQASHKAVEVAHTETKKESAKTEVVAEKSPFATDATLAQACK